MPRIAMQQPVLQAVRVDLSDLFEARGGAAVILALESELERILALFGRPIMVIPAPDHFHWNH